MSPIDDIEFSTGQKAIIKLIAQEVGVILAAQLEKNIEHAVSIHRAGCDNTKAILEDRAARKYSQKLLVLFVTVMASTTTFIVTKLLTPLFMK